MDLRVIVVAAVLVLVAFAAGGQFNPRVITVQAPPTRILTNPSPSTTIFVPAVDQDGQGVVTEVQVQVLPGSGRTLASIEDILFFVDTQASIRTAREVASTATGFDLSLHDLVYTVTANASAIEGPSAGAALTIATIAALEGKPLREDVMITGTIEPDGSIGQVGEVERKAMAAKAAGAALFLIPAGSDIPEIYTYERLRTCQPLQGVQFCEISYVRTPTGNLGIEVREVGTVQEALASFLEEPPVGEGPA
ncbi:MAG: hypothetical protein HY520_04575 [Candidatus Aenigmarchaeota archaeon]|nr:hypothetical protein [Candidatus Aenigmarchaeota archaeon]